MTSEEISFFNTFGFFLSSQLLPGAEMDQLSGAFDRAMDKARDGAPIPVSGQKRQQVIPFFDYDPDTFYPLLDDERIIEPFAALLGEDFLLTLSEGIIHTGGSGWHHDACAPDGLTTMRAAIYAALGLVAFGSEAAATRVGMDSSAQQAAAAQADAASSSLDSSFHFPSFS